LAVPVPAAPAAIAVANVTSFPFVLIVAAADPVVN
jgi:hypothetical protein